jgi:arginase family enzyme
MSVLRARCPDCLALTAVAVEDGYECHRCGRSFRAGLVRVPRAWGSGGDDMAAAADLPLPYPTAARIDEPTLAAQHDAIASSLPERPIVLGGCCCAHVGAVAGLSSRPGRLGLVWLDAHGDLNTPETSPSGNPWGMPLRMILDSGSIRVEDCVLVGARNLDPAEEEFIRSSGLAVGPHAVPLALAAADSVYVAFDADVLEPGEGVAMHMPEPAGLRLGAAERLLGGIAATRRVAGMGVSGLGPAESSVPALTRLLASAGL